MFSLNSLQINYIFEAVQQCRIKTVAYTVHVHHTGHTLYSSINKISFLEYYVAQFHPASLTQGQTMGALWPAPKATFVWIDGVSQESKERQTRWAGDWLSTSINSIQLWPESLKSYADRTENNICSLHLPLKGKDSRKSNKIHHKNGMKL